MPTPHQTSLFQVPKPAILTHDVPLRGQPRPSTLAKKGLASPRDDTENEDAVFRTTLLIDVSGTEEPFYHRRVSNLFSVRIYSCCGQRDFLATDFKSQKYTPPSSVWMATHTRGHQMSALELHVHHKYRNTVRHWQRSQITNACILKSWVFNTVRVCEYKKEFLKIV